MLSIGGFVGGWVAYPLLAVRASGRRWGTYLPWDRPPQKRGDPYNRARSGDSASLRRMEVVSQRLRFSCLVSALALGGWIGLLSFVKWLG